jgi:hypothetical protein
MRLLLTYIFFIHLNRLSSCGVFGLVAIHALCHIKVCLSLTLSLPSLFC